MRERGTRPAPTKALKGALIRKSYFFDDEAEVLQQAAAEKRTWEAEIIRRAVRRYLKIGPAKR